MSPNEVTAPDAASPSCLQLHARGSGPGEFTSEARGTLMISTRNKMWIWVGSYAVL